MSAQAESGAATLVDRRRECGIIDQLLSDVIAGRSHVTVLRGEAGVGKSALLNYLSDRAAGCRIARAAGVESEMELAYSGLHQLCSPLLGLLEKLHAPQRDALATVFGQSAGAGPDRFLVGIATLSLLAEVAEQQPLVCIIDDAQWLDQASAQVLGFVARRLVAERVAIVCAARTGIGDNVLAGLPEWPIQGLPDSDARALLLGNVRSPLDAAVCAQIIAESQGNPLALLELPRTWDAVSLAGGFGLPGNEPVETKIEQSYELRLRQLPTDTQLLVLTAAAEPLGDPVLLHRAVELLGVGSAAAGPALDAGLLKINGRVKFAHPLVRSTAYRSAAALDRHKVHRALAEATDPDTDPDRRAWHRARATRGPDEEVAAELEQSASRAQARGGVAAAAAFLQRAVALTADPARRAERAMAGAQASLQAGAFGAALELLATAETGELDGFQRARLDLLRTQVGFVSGANRNTPPQLLKAAQRLEQFDAKLARETYLAAWAASSFAGNQDRGDTLTICRAILELPANAGTPTPLELLLKGVALLETGGHAAAAPTLHEAKPALLTVPIEDVLRWGWQATAASDATWDNDATRAISERATELARSVGALAQLVFALTTLGNADLRSGDFAGAAVHIAEAEAIAAATGTRYAPYTALRLLALQGKETEATSLIAQTLERAAAEGQGLPAEVAHMSAAILANSLGRYDEAVQSARLAASGTSGVFIATWALPELIEAAVRNGETELARTTFDRLVTVTQPCGTDWALGIEARCRALLEIGDTDDLFLEAIDRLGRARLGPELARSHLLYGEWLRRNGRRVDAREQLRVAHDMCATIGMQAFAERARRELAATGAKARKRSEEARAELTPQEEQIARLARDGLTNPDIGAMLFLSPRTVEWHLRNVFTKLGISSRNGLHTALPTVTLQVGNPPGAH